MAVLARRASDVRINEVDLSTSLSGVSAATAAIVVVSAQGRDKATFYSSPDDFLFDYGNPNAAVSYDHYAALDYLREGNSLWAIRATGAGAKYAAAVVKLDASLKTVVAGISAGVVDPDSPDWGAYTPSTETPLYLITPARGQGSLGNNIAVSMEAANLETVTGLSGTTTSVGGQLVAATYEYVVSAISAGGTETLASAPMTVVVGSATTTNTITISWPALTGAIGYKVYGRVSGNLYLITFILIFLLVYNDHFQIPEPYPVP